MISRHDFGLLARQQLLPYAVMMWGLVSLANETRKGTLLRSSVRAVLQLSQSRRANVLKVLYLPARARHARMMQ
jgi:hypothetical protein